MSSVLKAVSFVAAAILAIGIAHAAAAIDALPDGQFVVYVQQANDFEIDSGRMALQKSENDAIQNYAKRMIAERREIAIALSGARTAARVGYASMGGARSRYTAVLDRLGTLNGTAFDAAFSKAQLAAQIEAVDEVDAYAQNGSNADLRRFAQETLPRLQSQLEHARRLAGL